MTSALPIIGIKCHYCSQFYPRHEIVFFGESISRCWKCHQKHLDALDVLAGNPPMGCGECGLTFQRLAELAPGEHVSLFAHTKDGIYQLLCQSCSDAYIQKRKDLFGPTRFGWDRKLN